MLDLPQSWHDLPRYSFYRLDMPDDFRFDDEVREWLETYVAPAARDFGDFVNRLTRSQRTWMMFRRSHVGEAKTVGFYFANHYDRLLFKLRWWGAQSPLD